MTHRRAVAILALASFLAPPAVASAAIVTKWGPVPGQNYAWEPEASGDLDGNGTYEMVTIEAAGGPLKIGIRSGSTGLLLAQTTGTYTNPGDFLLQNVDENGPYEILFTDKGSGNLVCLSYTNGSSTLAERFNFKPTPNGVPTQWQFADLDGTGQLFLVFRDETSLSNNYYVRDNNGGLVATITPSGAPSGSGWSRYLYVDDFDADGRQELLIQYTKVGSADVNYMYESNAPASPMAAAARTPNSTDALQADGHHGPYATSVRPKSASRQPEPVIVDGTR